MLVARAGVWSNRNSGWASDHGQGLRWVPHFVLLETHSGVPRSGKDEEPGLLGDAPLGARVQASATTGTW